MSELIKQAYSYAESAHRGQVRKYTNEPYITHPLVVSELVREYTYGREEMVCAALLHDVVEDTVVTFKNVYDIFGPKVGDLVFWLTDVSKPDDGNRKIRKRLDRLHIWGAPIEAQMIKCADIIDNTSSILEHDPKFAKVYLKEKKLLMEGFSDELKDMLIYAKAMENII